MKPPSPRRPAAFTLIELLIVVAIIAILAAIAVPNFLEAQIRSKVSRTRADMRTLAVAVEAYSVDHNEAPFRRNVINAAQRPCVPETGNRLAQLSVLTTPVAFLTSLPSDVFETHLRPPNNVLDYFDPVQTSWMINCRFPSNSPMRITAEEARWILVSVGPDSYLGALNGQYGWPMPNDPSLSFLGTMYVLYDPTNGTVSRGNIYSGARGTEGTPPFLQDRFGL